MAAMLNFDANVKKVCARHQCESRYSQGRRPVQHPWGSPQAKGKVSKPRTSAGFCAQTDHAISELLSFESKKEQVGLFT